MIKSNTFEMSLQLLLALMIQNDLGLFFVFCFFRLTQIRKGKGGRKGVSGREKTWERMHHEACCSEEKADGCHKSEVAGESRKGTWVLRWAEEDKFESRLLGSGETRLGLGAKTPAGLSMRPCSCWQQLRKYPLEVRADLTARGQSLPGFCRWVSPVQALCPALYLYWGQGRKPPALQSALPGKPPADFSRLPAGLRRVSVGSHDSTSLAGRQRLPLQPTLPR